MSGDAGNDTLYGGGNPNGSVNSAIRNAVTEWKASALGVIVDHRAGNGGTIDARNNAEGGATFTVTLRRSATPVILSWPTRLGSSATG